MGFVCVFVYCVVPYVHNVILIYICRSDTCMSFLPMIVIIVGYCFFCWRYFDGAY